MPTTLKNEAAIVGIGETEYSKNSGRSELALASEACAAAIRDAGLTPADIDGLTTFTMDTSDEIEVARAVGIQDLTFFSRTPHGGGAAIGGRGDGEAIARDFQPFAREESKWPVVRVKVASPLSAEPNGPQEDDLREILQP